MAELRSTRVFDYSFSVEEFREEEIDIAQILVQLPQLVMETTTTPRFPLPCWGSKRRRSAFNVSPTPSPQRIVVDQSPLSLSCSQPNQITSNKQITSPPPPPPHPNSINGARIKVEETSSPVTPFCFSPSESDYKSEHHTRKPSKKQSYEMLKEQYADSLDQNIHLRQSLQSVVNHHKSLDAFNKSLHDQKRKYKLMYPNGRKAIDSNPVVKAASEGNIYQQQQIPMEMYKQQIPRTMLSNREQAEKIYERNQYPCNRFGDYLVHPLGGDEKRRLNPVPDLNYSAQDASKFDFYSQFSSSNKAAVFAQARKRRFEKRQERKCGQLRRSK